ncbi:MAG: hypothetical protein FLDDKLPJ_00653 [Phycisphaerae bacterium]|nr:hypothetical protein [Phycisphaerae bacterium]
MAIRWLLLGTRGQAVDGDEAILGLMAGHLLDGRGVPFFFYGQRYGFSLVEASLAAAGYALFGRDDAVLKWSMLPLWTAGWMFAVLTVRRRAGAGAAAVAGLLLALSPAWLFWSMKARGGYLTSFAAAHAVIWLCDGGAAGRSRADAARGASLLRNLFIGGGLGLVYWAQPLWLPCAAPFVAVYLFRARSAATTWAVAGSLLAAVMLGYVASTIAASAVWSPEVFSEPDPLFALRDLPRRLTVYFASLHAYTVTFPAGPLGTAWATLMLAATAAMPATLLLRRRRRDGGHRTLALQCAAAGTLMIMMTFAASPRLFFCRYLAPLGAVTVMFLAAGWSGWYRRGGVHRTWSCGALALAAALAAGAAWELRPYREAVALPTNCVTSPAEIDALVSELEAAGVGHVYCMDAMLQWHVIYASRERVLARWFEELDRVPEYPKAVDAALRENRPVALIGLDVDRADLNAYLDDIAYVGARARTVGRSFFLLPQPDEELLRRLRFKFADADTSPGARRRSGL